MKVGIFQDIHANLPAFKKGIEVFRKYKCSRIYHVGDFIGIGPYPREVIDLAASIKELEFIMGNHDYWFAFGLPVPIPSYMNNEEIEHHKWTHNKIGETHRGFVKGWEFIKELKFNNKRKITFQHYGFDKQSKWFKPFIHTPNQNNLDQLFEGINSDIIFYGHNHISSDVLGRCRYVNLGSAGCFNKSEVRLGILEISETVLKLEKLSIHYDDNGIMEEFERRKVPAREFIKKAFISRNS